MYRFKLIRWEFLLFPVSWHPNRILISKRTELWILKFCLFSGNNVSCGNFKYDNEDWKMNPHPNGTMNRCECDFKKLKLRKISKHQTLDSVIDEKFWLRFQTNVHIFGCTINVRWCVISFQFWMNNNICVCILLLLCMWISQPTPGALSSGTMHHAELIHSIWLTVCRGHRWKIDFGGFSCPEPDALCQMNI